MADFGIDISAYQTNSYNSPQRFFDPSIAKTKGVKFAFIRASLGLYKDKAVETFAKTFEDAGIPHGFYHCAKAEYSYLNQVDFFWNIIKNFKQQLPPVLDIELPGLGLDFAKAFLGRLETKSGKKGIIYTSPGFWNPLSGSSTAIWARSYKLWIANYLKALTFPVYGVPPEVLNSTKYPTIPGTWKAANIPYTFWQYCAVGNGEFYGGNYDPVRVEKVGLDLNVYNGTYEQFKKEFGITESGGQPNPDPEPEEPEGRPRKFVRTLGDLRGRTTPKYIEGDSALIFKKGERLEKADLPEEYEKASGITWLPVVMYVSKKWVEEA